MKNNFHKVVVVGASRGVGAAVAEHILPRTTELITVSRSPSNFGNWIKADISNKAGIETVTHAVGHSPLDAFVYGRYLGNSGFYPRIFLCVHLTVGYI